MIRSHPLRHKLFVCSVAPRLRREALAPTLQTEELEAKASRVATSRPAGPSGTWTRFTGRCFLMVAQRLVPLKRLMGPEVITLAGRRDATLRGVQPRPRRWTLARGPPATAAAALGRLPSEPLRLLSTRSQAPMETPWALRGDIALT